ncbi:MAG: BON domain-containing protein [Anaerolineae bacterium]|nr:BON domain-containing protein [Anaerolineae bacterium]
MTVSERRPDVDIEDDIRQLIRSFAPLKASRDYFDFRSQNGVVKLWGNVRTTQARRVLLDNVPRVSGVMNCVADDLCADEDLRFEVAQLLPPGVFANVHYGTVTISGKLPEGASVEAISDAVRHVSGVRRVVTDLK